MGQNLVNQNENDRSVVILQYPFGSKPELSCLCLQGRRYAMLTAPSAVSWTTS